MRYKNIFNKFFVGLILLLLSSCNPENMIHHSSKDLNDSGWMRRDSLIFEVDNIDSTNICDININIRNNNFYPYSNLGLLFIIEKGDSIIFTDTLNITMSYENGIWRGNGWGSLYEFKSNLIRDYNFESSGFHRLILLQYMDKNPLPGLSATGLELD